MKQKNFEKLIVRLQISSKNHIFKYKYFRVNKLGITSKLKKKRSTSRFFGEKNFEKKIRSLYHKASEISAVTYVYTYIRTYVRTPTHTYRLFLKTGFLASWGLKTCLYAKKSKIKISPKTMVPLWGNQNALKFYKP